MQTLSQPLRLYQSGNPPNRVRTAKIFPQPALPKPSRTGCPQSIEATQASPEKHQTGFERYRCSDAWQWPPIGDPCDDLLR